MRARFLVPLILSSLLAGCRPAFYGHPVTISISPTSAAVRINATQPFTANLTCGCKEGQVFSGQVTWQVNGVQGGDSTHGTIPPTSTSNGVTATATYTAPAVVPNPATATITAVSVDDPTKSASATITIVSMSAGMSAKLEGSYAFLFKASGAGGIGSLAGSFVADASGNLFAGVEAVVEETGMQRTLPFAGTYVIGPDQRGALMLETAAASSTLQIVLDAKGGAQILELDNPGKIRGAGVLERQMPASFSLPAFSGDFSLALSGVADSGEQVSVLGGFSADGGGQLSGGRLLIVGAGSEVTKLGFHGGYQIAPDGRGVATLTSSETGPLEFSFYVISDEKALFIGEIPEGGKKLVLAGEARRAPHPKFTGRETLRE
jgi:hypothetical protein